MPGSGFMLLQMKTRRSAPDKLQKIGRSIAPCPGPLLPPLAGFLQDDDALVIIRLTPLGDLTQ